MRWACVSHPIRMRFACVPHRGPRLLRPAVGGHPGFPTALGPQSGRRLAGDPSQRRGNRTPDAPLPCEAVRDRRVAERRPAADARGTRPPRRRRRPKPAWRRDQAACRVRPGSRRIARAGRRPRARLAPGRRQGRRGRELPGPRGMERSRSKPHVPPSGGPWAEERDGRQSPGSASEWTWLSAPSTPP